MEITVLNRTNENLDLYSNLFKKISCSAEKLLKLDEDYDGLLHCLGYDHMEEKDAEVMFKLQDEILDPIQPRK